MNKYVNGGFGFDTALSLILLLERGNVKRNFSNLRALIRILIQKLDNKEDVFYLFRHPIPMSEDHKEKLVGYIQSKFDNMSDRQLIEFLILKTTGKRACAGSVTTEFLFDFFEIPISLMSSFVSVCAGEVDVLGEESKDALLRKIWWHSNFCDQKG